MGQLSLISDGITAAEEDENDYVFISTEQNRTFHACSTPQRSPKRIIHISPEERALMNADSGSDSDQCSSTHLNAEAPEFKPNTSAIQTTTAATDHRKAHLPTYPSMQHTTTTGAPTHCDPNLRTSVNASFHSKRSVTIRRKWLRHLRSWVQTPS